MFEAQDSTVFVVIITQENLIMFSFSVRPSGPYFTCLAAWSKALLAKPAVVQTKIFSAFYRTRRFRIVFTGTQFWTLSLGRYPIYTVIRFFSNMHFEIMLRRWLDLPSERRTSSFLAKTFYAFYVPLHAICTAHPTDMKWQISEDYIRMILINCSLRVCA
jgi:hypothetical protein